ncbi:MAG: long-chain fatty acid--CoA ligase [Burkholderiales bacterium]|nr:long-chain fatty acid--CoA ligase [Burkholderiales bacterium]
MTTPAAADPTRHYAFWPKRLPRHLSPPETTLWANLDITQRRFPDHPLFVFFGRVIYTHELHAAVERLAGWLHTVAGVRRGDRVALCMQNSPQYAIAFYAVLRLNAVVVPVNPMNKAAELTHYITDPGARVAIVGSDLAGEWAAANAEVARDDPARALTHLLVTRYSDEMHNHRVPADGVPEAWRAWLDLSVPLAPYGHDWREVMATEVPAHPAPAAGGHPDDLAVLPYTSGTTGLPKGCMHTHRTIMHNVVAGAIWGDGTSETVSLAAVPMFHITGMLYCLHLPIYLGSCAVIMPRWDRDVAGELISKWKIDSWTMVPTMIIDLLGSPNVDRYDLSSLQYIGGGGAAMPQAVAQRLLEQFDLTFMEGYGLTETAAPSHSNPFQRPKQQCLGVPYMSVDARVVDPETLRPCAVNEPGEILIHGPQVFKGYWQNRAATEAAFVQIDGKWFFRSGDMGRVDEDGYFFMTDRLKRMINASGFKVWPAEVEALLFRHPAVQEACVIATRDAYRGESVKAVIVLRGNAKGTTAQEIIDWAHDNMAAYKVPRSVEFVDALPKSGSGKVMWRALQERETGG